MRVPAGTGFGTNWRLARTETARRPRNEVIQERAQQTSWSNRHMRFHSPSTLAIAAALATAALSGCSGGASGTPAPASPGAPQQNAGAYRHAVAWDGALSVWPASFTPTRCAAARCARRPPEPRRATSPSRSSGRAASSGSRRTTVRTSRRVPVSRRRRRTASRSTRAETYGFPMAARTRRPNTRRSAAPRC